MKDYVLHTLTIPMGVDGDWERAEEILLEVANRECAVYLDKARNHFNKLSHRLNIAAASVEPRVTVEIPKPDQMNVILRFPAPFAKKWTMEQAILRQFLRSYKLAGNEQPVEDQFSS